MPAWQGPPCPLRALVTHAVLSPPTQVCLLDLDYNLPVQVRDTALGLTNDEEPQSDVGKEYQLHQRVKEGENGASDSSFAEARPNDMLLRLQRTTPYYKVRVLCAHVCGLHTRAHTHHTHTTPHALCAHVCVDCGRGWCVLRR